jgi:hypothetical protein
MRWRIPITIALIALVAVSCDQQPAQPELQDTPTFDGATVINEVVYRWPGRITWMDSTDDWDVFLLGHDPADDFTCHDGQSVGGVPFREHSVIKHDMKTESYRDVVIGSMIGRQPLYLYTRASFPPGDATFDEWCDYLINDWLAAGSWHTQSADNDVSGGDGTPGENSFGLVETGTLVDRDGNRYKYEWKYHCRFNPEADPPFRCRNGVDGVTRIGKH